MAERRYGFRFSFAEGCVLVSSALLASFLIFVFGVYAGKELEARQAAENTRTVRVATQMQDRPIASFQSGEEAAVSQKKVFTEKPGASSTIPPTASVAVPAQNTVEPVQKTPEAPPAEPPVSPRSVAPVSSPLVKSASSPSTHNSPPLQATPRPSSVEIASSVIKKPSGPSGRWSVQVQATKDEEAAQSLVKQLRDRGYAPVMNKIQKGGDVWYRIRVGSFATEDAARASVIRLRRDGKFSQAYLVSD
jgi:septal ring-binding cell division protein DamX